MNVKIFIMYSRIIIRNTMYNIHLPKYLVTNILCPPHIATNKTILVDKLLRYWDQCVSRSETNFPNTFGGVIYSSYYIKS